MWRNMGSVYATAKVEGFVTGGVMRYFWHKVLGKTVFLTRAEAEAALRREQDGQDN